VALVHNLRTGDRFAESKEWQRQIDEAVLVLLDIFLVVQDFIKFEDDQPSDESSCRSNGRNNLACNKLDLVSVGKLNLIVLSSQVACCSDKVNVMVSIVIFLEFNRLELEASQRLGSRELVSDPLELIAVLEAGRVGIWILI
jgi:hypothetical protein